MSAGTQKGADIGGDGAMFAGTQKGADIGGDGAMFAGSKKCTRNSTDCPRCLRIQKNAPATVLIAHGVCGYSKRYLQDYAVGLLSVPIGTQKDTCKIVW